MKTVLVLMVVIVCLFVVSEVRADCTGTIFSDVSEASVGAQFCDYIERFSVLGITTGYPDGTYRPWNNVNRAQMAAFVIRTIDNVVKPASPIPNFEGEVCWQIQQDTETFLLKLWVNHLGNSHYFLSGKVYSNESLHNILLGNAEIEGSNIYMTLITSGKDTEAMWVGITYVILDSATLNGTFDSIGHDRDYSEVPAELEDIYIDSDTQYNNGNITHLQCP